MKRWIFGILCICLSAISVAQENLLPDGATVFEGSSKSWFVDLNVWGHHGSNAVSNSFVDRFLFGGFIDFDEKNEVLDRLNTNNSIGAEVGARLAVSYRSMDKQYAWQVVYAYTRLQRIDFEEDLFKLIFEGNTQFTQNQIVLNNSSSIVKGFHKWQFGLVDVESGSFARVGVYGGNNFSEVKLGTASLQTIYSSAGEYTFPASITAVTDGFSELNDNGNGMFGSGIGIGLDAQINRQFSFGTLSLALNDFGFMRWSELTQRRSDTKVEFEGFQFNFDNNGISLGTAESIRDSIFDIQSEITRQVRLLPWQLTATFISKADERLFTSAQINLRPAAYAIPHLNASLNYKLVGASFIWLSGSIGGPERFGFGAGAMFNIFDDIFLTLSSRNAFGWVSPNGLSRSLCFQFIQRI